MKVGLLWFDDDPGRELDEKVGRAARYYRRKLGHQPNVCYIHPGMLDEKPQPVGEVRVEALSAVQRHYFFVSFEGGGTDDCNI